MGQPLGSLRNFFLRYATNRREHPHDEQPYPELSFSCGHPYKYVMLPSRRARDVAIAGCNDHRTREQDVDDNFHAATGIEP
ncbi:hypothetical protein ACFL59_02385 [Planctomycetota bacterium]